MERNEIVSAVEEELAGDLDALDTSTTTTTNIDCAEPLPKKPMKGTLIDLSSDLLGTETAEASPINTAEKADREVAKYVALEPVQDHHPLKWRKENSHRLPLLPKLAKKYLCVPVTSVPSARAFSLAGYIMNQRRACLLPENVNMLVYY